MSYKIQARVRAAILHKAVTRITVIRKAVIMKTKILENCIFIIRTISAEEVLGKT